MASAEVYDPAHWHFQAASAAAIDLLEPDLSGAVDAAGRAVAVGSRYEGPLIAWATATLGMALAETGEVGRAIDTIESTISDALANDLPVQTGDTLLGARPVALAAGQTTLVARLWGGGERPRACRADRIPADDRFVARADAGAGPSTRPRSRVRAGLSRGRGDGSP